MVYCSGGGAATSIHDELSSRPGADMEIDPAPRLSPLRVAGGLLRSLRPKQWAKNVLLYAGVVFAGELGDLSLVVLATAAFGVFCALSAAAYLVNDLFDAESDTAHPRKRHRPIAAGIVPRWLAGTAALLLAAGGLAGAGFVNPQFLAAAAGYLALTLGYSVLLKNVLLVDVLALALGYVLRAAAGAIAVDVAISPWLLLCTILVALFIGLTKRRHELLLLDEAASDHRRILDEYSGPLLDQLISLVSSATLIAYALYTFFSEHGRNNELLVVTLPFVVYGLFRYLYLVYKRGEGGSPEDLIFSDVPMLVCVALWALSVVLLIYWR